MTRVWNRAAALLLSTALLLGLFALVPAQAKTIPACQAVETL